MAQDISFFTFSVTQPHSLSALAILRRQLGIPSKRRAKRRAVLTALILCWTLSMGGELFGAALPGETDASVPHQHYSDNLDNLREQARQLETAQHYQEAELLYRTILTRQPTNDDVRAALARVLSWQGSYAEATDLYRSLVQRHPHDLDLKTALARVLSWQQSTAEANALYGQVLRENPNHAEALEGLANLLYWDDRLDEALPYYEQAYAITQNPALAERISLIKNRQ
ncbi:MAG: tetratricopeptide repeat protein, partial [Nitrospira sp.]|nr:tetratricopeptide repeat protein [Nitrospira sp.]